MPLHHPGLTPPPRRADTEYFFSEVVPAALRARTEAARYFGFSLVIDIEGAGIWTVDLKEPAVHKDAGLRMDALVSMSRADFESLIAGRLNGVEAWRANKILIAGDLRALEALVLLLK